MGLFTKVKDKVTSKPEITRTILKHYKESLSSMKSYHADWKEFMQFYEGNHWNTKRASWRPDPVINYISYVVDQKRPQLTNNRPTGILLPVAEGDEEAAKIFTQVTDVIADKNDLDSVTDEVVQNGLLLDIGYYYTYWDESLSGGSVEKKNLWKGDVVIESVDPCNLYIDPQATTMQASRYVIYAVPKTVQWVKEKFGKDVEPDSVQSFETEIYDRPDANNSGDRVMLYAYWTREDGKLNVTYSTETTVLKETRGLYKHGRYPFIPFVAKRKNKSIIGIGEPRNVINNQKLLNKLVEMPTLSTMLTGNPITLLSRKSGIKKEHWVNKPGLVFEVNDEVDKAVKQVVPPNFSSDVYKLADMMQSYIEKIGGVYDSMTGNTPKGVTAAAAIQLLQEQGSIPIKGISRNLYATMTELYKQIIELVKEHYTETRYIRITGEKGETQFIKFNAADYADVDFDIKVSAGASTAMSRAYISQLANELYDRKLLLGSEYVEMQDGLPNKERIVARLRELESKPPMQPGQPMQQGATPQAVPQQGFNLEQIYEQSPPELQQEIDLMREQGMSDEEIVQWFMDLANQPT